MVGKNKTKLTIGEKYAIIQYNKNNIQTKVELTKIFFLKYNKNVYRNIIEYTLKNSDKIISQYMTGGKKI